MAIPTTVAHNNAAAGILFFLLISVVDADLSHHIKLSPTVDTYGRSIGSHANSCDDFGFHFLRMVSERGKNKLCLFHIFVLFLATVRCDLLNECVRRKLHALLFIVPREIRYYVLIVAIQFARFYFPLQHEYE